MYKKIRAINAIMKNFFRNYQVEKIEHLPWITFGAIDFLKSNLSDKMTVFEWGSGDSTLFFAKRVKQVISIEHGPYWYKKLSKELEREAIKNVNLSLVEPVLVDETDSLYISTDGKYVGKDLDKLSFEDYVKAIDNFPDEYFDMVLVDGRARPGCIRHALPKIKKGGYLLLDNSERPEYQHVLPLLEHWRETCFFGNGPNTVSEWETKTWQKN